MDQGEGRAVDLEGNSGCWTSIGVQKYTQIKQYPKQDIEVLPTSGLPRVVLWTCFGGCQ